MSSLRSVIEKVIDAGTHAPSGDNCQPWRFEVKNNKIFLFLLKKRDVSLYSWGNRASLIANGAALENMEIAAEKFGLLSQVELLPAGQESSLVAIITLTEGTQKDNILYDSIFQRTTNRKPYKNLSLSNEEQEYFQNCGQDKSEIRITLIDGEINKKELGKIAAINEKILFSNFSMHNFFYDHINWDAGEELRHRLGFYVKTLEIPGLALAGFKMAKNWKIMEFLNKTLKFSNFIAKQNAKNYSACSAFGLIILKDTSEQSYISAGKVFEKLWLKVTKRGLNLQPLTGVFLLMQRILAKQTETLSAEHIEFITAGYKKTKEIFRLNEETIALMFRIGHGDQPSARTLRLPAEIKWLA